MEKWLGLTSNFIFIRNLMAELYRCNPIWAYESARAVVPNGLSSRF